MAFTTITSGEITTGEPTSADLFTKIKDDLDDLNTRLTATEGSINVYDPWIFTVIGAGQIRDGIMDIRVPFDINILGVRLYVSETEGTPSGSLTIDVEKKVGAGSFTTILSSVLTKSSTTTYAVSSATLSVTTAGAGDYLRINQDAVMTGVRGYTVIVEFEKA